MRLKSSSRIHTDIVPLNAKGPTAGVLAALLLSACGGGSGNPTPSPQGSYDLQVAMVALVESGLSANVNLSGTAIVNDTSNPFTGTGTLTLSPGVSGTFNGMMAQLQTESISGTVTVAGRTSPYNSSVMSAYEPASAAIEGESQSTEFDVAQQPIMIPTVVGTSVTMVPIVSYAGKSNFVTPACTQPARLECDIDAAPDLIVTLKGYTADPKAVAAELEKVRL
jgi:hypothetical protein